MHLVTPYAHQLATLGTEGARRGCRENLQKWWRYHWIPLEGTRLFVPAGSLRSRGSKNVHTSLCLIHGNCQEPH